MYEPLSDISLELLEAQALKELEEMESVYLHVDTTYGSRLDLFLSNLSNVPTDVLVHYYIHNKLPKEAYEYDCVMKVFCGWVNNPATKEIIKQELLYRRSKMTFYEKAQLPVDLLLVS